MVKGFIFFRTGKIPFVIENYRMDLFTDDSLLEIFCKEYNFKCLLDRIIVNLSYRNENQYNYPYCHAQASELHEEYFVVGHHM